MTTIPNTLRRKIVWPGKLRLAHWGIALSVLALMITAWLMYWAPTLAGAASDYHYIFGALLIISLLGRSWLFLTDQDVGSWRALLPSSTTIQKSVEMLKFYLSFGAAPLPNWYAHNPLWLPIYAILLISLVAMAASGMLMTSHPVVLGIYLPAFHKGLASIVSFITIAHIATVIFHDARGKHADISGMLNGYRVFEMEGLDVDAGEHKINQIKITEVKTYKPGDPE